MVTVARDGGSLTPLSLPRRDMVPRCCENGRPVVADPHTGQTICSCQYGTGLLAYPRVPSLGDAVYGTSAAYAAAAAQSYVPLGADGSAFYSPLTSPPYDGAKEAVEGWRHLAHSGGMYFPYDTSMAAYSYGAGFGPMDLNAARRKNATKEATNTLKAWLYEHRKNPYPTKGEKIMLAIITKMTLTQVSTWFANARRRLKKENKMTWSPRNRSDDDDGDDFDDIGEDDKEGDDKDKMTSSTSDRVESLSSPGSPISARIVESSQPDSAEANELGDGHITVDDDLPPSPPPSKRRRTDSFLNSDSDDQQEGESSLPDLGVPGCKDVATRYSPSAGEICSSRLSLDKLSSSSKKSEDGEANGESSPRPKIWSVSQFLPTNSDNHRSRESAVTSSLSLSTSHPYHMTSPSTHRGHATSAAQLHPFLTSAGTHGSFGSPMSYVTHPLPITLGSSALPFPYSLSSVKPSSIGPSTTMSRQEALLATAAAVRSRTDISHGARDLSLTRPTNSLEKGDNSPAS